MCRWRCWGYVVPSGNWISGVKELNSGRIVVDGLWYFGPTKASHHPFRMVSNATADIPTIESEIKRSAEKLITPMQRKKSRNSNLSKTLRMACRSFLVLTGFQLRALSPFPYNPNFYSRELPISCQWLLSSTAPASGKFRRFSSVIMQFTYSWYSQATNELPDTDYFAEDHS